MDIIKAQKKPVIVEAVQYDGYNGGQIAEWCGGQLDNSMSAPHEKKIVIPTLEGEVTASFKDYIIKGVAGEFYPCKPKIFAETYEIIEED